MAEGQPGRSAIKPGLLVALAVFAIIAMLQAIGRLQGLDNGLLTLRFDLRGEQAPSANLILLAGRASGGGQSGGGPWTPGGLTQVVRDLDAAGASIIALDLPGLAERVSVANDHEVAELARAIESHGRVVLPLVIQEKPPARQPSASVVARFSCGPGTLRRPPKLEPGYLVAPRKELCDAAAGLGATNVYVDTDGVVREAPLMVSWEGRLYPAFWLEVLRVHEGASPGATRREGRRVTVAQRSFQTDSDAEVFINYAGGYEHFPQVPYPVAGGVTELAGYVRGKIVLVGSDVAGFSSYLPTPTAPMMPGVEVAANILNGLITEGLLTIPPVWLQHLISLLVALFVGLLVAPRRPAKGLVVTLLIFLVVAACGVALFFWGIYLPLAQPLMVAAVAGGFLMAEAAAIADRERARADAQLQSRLQAIAGIARLVSSSLDRERLLLETLRWIEGEIDAETCSLLLMEEDDRHLRFELALGDKGAMLEDFRLEVGKGIAGTAAQEKEPVVVDDVHADPRWAQDIADAIDYQTRSILCVPMMLHDRVTGVIEVINKRGGRFTDYDVQLLTVIAQQAAFFLENARLYRELSDRVDFANKELRGTNQRLAAEMARISILLDGMGDGVIGTDGRDHVVLLNDVAESMFDLRESEAIGQSVHAVVKHPGLVDLFNMPLSPHGGSHETEITVDEASGQVVRAHIALVEEPSGEMPGKVAVFSDITHLKELDRMKMDLVSFVSHELKNPIGSLQGVCDLLHRRVSQDDDRTRQLLEIAMRQSKRMQYLVQDFLDLSRIEAGERLELDWSEVSDIDEMIRSVFQLTRTGGPDHVFESDVAPDLGPFFVDRNKIESVLINLVENGVKYSPDGGRVTVRVFPREDQVIFEVQDEGVGIREADLGRLFKSFQRVHDATFGRVSGTGVGLYICRHIIEAHGGTIDVESIWGEGSTFRLRLPHYVSAPDEAEAPADAEG